MLIDTQNRENLIDNEIPDITDSIKVDKEGRRYIDDPNTPNGRTYLYDSPVTNYDIMKKAAEEDILPESWLSNSPISYQVADGYDTNMSYDTLLNPELREDYFAKQQSLL